MGKLRCALLGSRRLAPNNESTAYQGETMQDKPLIKTAIPRRRYQIGDFSASLLGDIESGDARAFRYILAFVPMGHAEPALYVCAEPSPPAEVDRGRYRLRVINASMSEIMDSDDRWGDLDEFAGQAVRLGTQVLGLQREQVLRLL